MVKNQKHGQFPWKKAKEHTVEGKEEEDDDPYYLRPFSLNLFSTNNKKSRAKPKLYPFLFILLSLLLLLLLSLSLFLAPHFLSSNSTTFSFLYSFGGSETDLNASPCSSITNGTICCDRSSYRTDICIMNGDVRTHSVSSSIVLYTATSSSSYVSSLSYDDHKEDEYVIQHEKIRPYTRKWELDLMVRTVTELELIVKRKNFGTRQSCGVVHNVPAVFFSTGGYTGNLYHEFNDGILPLYITSQHLDKKVVFVIVDYHNWWMMKYGDIVSQLSNFPPVDFHGDKRIHCFPKAIVGLRIYNELTIKPLLMENNKTIGDFRELLDRAYWPRIRGLIQDEEREARLNEKKSAFSSSSRSRLETMKKPKLVIISRKGSRAITNENSLVKMAKSIGFLVDVLKPEAKTELAKVYRVLNSSDVMVGVHGAALTHFLFMRPGSVFIQIIPLGTEWAARGYYEKPARKLGLRYVAYKILPKESSLYDDYDKNDPILNNPRNITKKGWEFTKKIYLDRQTVKLNLPRFRKRLLRAFYYSVAGKERTRHQ